MLFYYIIKSEEVILTKQSKNNIKNDTYKKGKNIFFTILKGLIFPIIVAIISTKILESKKTDSTNIDNDKCYIVQSNTFSPTIKVYPYEENITINPGDIITIEADDPDGIASIVYAWDSNKATTVYYSKVAIVVAPTVPGIHTLFFCSRDATKDFNKTGNITIYYNIRPRK